MNLRFARDVFIALFFGALAGLGAATLLPGCTPTQQQTLGSLATNPTTVTGLKIAACVQGVIAEEEQQRLRERREAEAAAAEEAERIDEAAREHPPSVKTEIEKVLRDGGSK